MNSVHYALILRLPGIPVQGIHLTGCGSAGRAGSGVRDSNSAIASRNRGPFRPVHHEAEEIMKQAFAFALITLALFAATGLFPENAQASTPQDVEEMRTIMLRYGKAHLVDFIIEHREGYVTIEKDGGMADFLGKPNMEYITPETLLADVHKMDMDIDGFSRVFVRDMEEVIEEQSAAVERKLKEVRAEKQREAQIRRQREIQEKEAAERRLLLQGNEMLIAGNPMAAQDTFSRAIRENPENANAWEGRARALISRKRWDSAMRDLNQALFLRPDYVDAYLARAVVWLEKGVPARAIVDAGRALDKEPKNHEAHYLMARAHHALGDLDAALTSAKKALELAPSLMKYQFFVRKLEASREVAKARIKLKSGAYKQAVNDLNNAIRVDPMDHESYLLRGQAQLGAGRIQKAIDDFNRALEFKPGNSQAYYWRSRGQEAGNNMAMALNDAQLAVAQAPENPVYNDRVTELRKKISASARLGDYALMAGAVFAGLGLLFGAYKGLGGLMKSARKKAARKKVKQEALRREMKAARKQARMDAKVKSAILKEGGPENQDSGGEEGGESGRTPSGPEPPREFRGPGGYK